MKDIGKFNHVFKINNTIIHENKLNRKFGQKRDLGLYQIKLI